MDRPRFRSQNGKNAAFVSMFNDFATNFVSTRNLV